MTPDVHCAPHCAYGARRRASPYRREDEIREEILFASALPIVLLA